ncbi:MAG TPA: aldo/keto reductase [Bryobacteraceae bacterium]|nr:aldo/keto reductase [Bryobacteraceae bacterium]
MRYRKLGRTGIEISDIGFGAWGIGGKQWIGGSDEESRAALRRALELGLNFIDTALAYGDGHSEVLVGEIVRSAPGKVYVATKVPPKNRQWPAKSGIGIEDVFPYDYVIKSTEESLRNLKLDAIDLQQLHVWNTEWTHRDEWKRAFEDLKKSGKAKAVGVSLNAGDPDSGLDLIRTGLCDSVQVVYNIFDQSPNANLLPLAKELNIGILARVPLDEGALTGTITEDTVFEKGEFRDWYFRGRDRKWQVVEHVNALNKDLEGVEGSLPEIALRYCLSHPAVSSVIPGMRKIRTVESSCSASDLGSLPAALLETLKKHAWVKDFHS